MRVFVGSIRLYDIIVWKLILIAFGIAAPQLGAADKATQPNVIVLLSDDVGYGEYGFQGNNEIPTPNIDSIAKNGVRFTQAYNAATYCSPCRAGFMTGRYPTRFGHEFNEGGAQGMRRGFGLPVEEKTIAERMKQLGYSTACVGKWHLGGGPQFIATARGFDEFYGTVANTPYFNPPNFIDTRKSSEVTPVVDDSFYTTDAYAARAVDWLSKQQGKPFFLYLPFNAQHGPLQAPQKYLDRFPKIENEKRRTFAAIMSAMDDAVGAVLSQVKNMGQEENTLIVFFSDNGGPTPTTTSKNDPLRGFKATTLEGGIRVPHCMQWKGHIKPGTTFDHPILNLDLLPTAVVAAGGKVDPSWKLDGVDLMPYLTGEKKGSPHDILYWRFGEQWAIRMGDWKLCANRIDGVNNPKLFNLKDDIGEGNDLSAAQPEKVKELQAAWNQWNSEQSEPRWRPQPRRARPARKAKA